MPKSGEATESPAAAELARSPAGSGRRPATSLVELEHVALELFAERGFERTRVEDIARAAGIGRRTFFRYFRSKKDVAWGDFDAHLERFRAQFDSVAAETPMAEALVGAILAFNEFPAEELPWHRRRMALLLEVPALQAHSALRYRAWRQVVAEFVGRRLGSHPDGLAPQVIAHGALGAAVAAYERWLAEESPVSLSNIMEEALGVWAAGLLRPESWGRGNPARSPAPGRQLGY